MLEFIVTPHAQFIPHMCVACGGSEGAMTDTHRELVRYGRVYLCRMCVTRAARAHGLVKGKRQDELMQAAKLLDQARDEITQRDARHDTLVAELDEERRRVAQLTEDVEYNAGRVKQLEERLSQHAKAALELVGTTD